MFPFHSPTGTWRHFQGPERPPAGRPHRSDRSLNEDIRGIQSPSVAPAGRRYYGPPRSGIHTSVPRAGGLDTLPRHRRRPSWRPFRPPVRAQGREALSLAFRQPFSAFRVVVPRLRYVARTREWCRRTAVLVAVAAVVAAVAGRLAGRRRRAPRRKSSPCTRRTTSRSE